MKRDHQICLCLTLLLLSLFWTSCNGQIKSSPDNNNTAHEPARVAHTARLIKPPGSDPNYNIHCSLEDKRGHLWFGTSGDGVYRYNGKEFILYTEEDGLSNNTIWCMLEDHDGNIWFGTDDGLSYYDGKNIQKISFQSKNKFSVVANNMEPGKNPVWSMMQDKSGILWVGTSKDLYCYDGTSFNRFLDRDHILNPQNLQLTWVQSLLEDSDGTIWIGSGPIAQEGVIRYNGTTLISEKPTGDGWIRKIVQDSSHNIWFSGRSQGVFLYDGKSFNKFTAMENIGSALLVDKRGHVWFDGGEKLNTIESDGGIWCYDGTSFINYNTKHGLGHYSVWSMLEDRSGNIWFGTRNSELYRFDGETFENFN